MVRDLASHSTRKTEQFIDVWGALLSFSFYEITLIQHTRDGNSLQFRKHTLLGCISPSASLDHRYPCVWPGGLDEGGGGEAPEWGSLSVCVRVRTTTKTNSHSEVWNAGVRGFADALPLALVYDEIRAETTQRTMGWGFCNL